MHESPHPAERAANCRVEIGKIKVSGQKGRGKETSCPAKEGSKAVEILRGGFRRAALLRGEYGQ